MTASPEVQSPTSAPTCGACGSEHPVGAQYCPACGSSVAPPPTCPACGAETSAEAKFCASCGVKLVGPRPAPAPRTRTAPPAEKPAPNPVAAQAAALPAPRAPSSNIGSNVLLFVAILLVLLVCIYQLNKDAPKEISPFEGGPPPPKVAAQADPKGPAATEPAAPAADPLTVTLGVADGLEVPQGTLFVIVRNAGVQRGPPLAVKKFDTPRLPMTFTVGPEDVMMKGMPFTGPFRVEARIDRDGNAMTKDAGDLVVSTPIEDAQPGAQVQITLDRRL